MPPIVAAIGAVTAAVTSAFVAIGFSAATAGVLAGAVIQIGGSLILSAAAAALMPKPKFGGAELKGRMVTARVPVAPRELVYGQVRKGGTIIFLHSTGAANKYLHMIIALAGHEVEGIGAVYFNGEEAVDASGTAVGRWAGLVTVEKALGDEDQTAFTSLQEETELWTAAHRLRGVAALYVRLTFDADAFPTGIPNITCDITGKNDIFDPRTDTTGWTDNAALCIADYMASTRFGIGARIDAEDGLDEASLIEAANVCDEEVTLDAGGTESRYTCNGVVTLDTEPQAIIEAMLTAMAGTCAWQGGAWRIHAGAYRAPTVTLGPGDVTEGGLTVSTRISMRENCNSVRGQFVSPDNDWQADDFPAYQSAVYLAEDGGEERWRDVVLPFTTSATAAQRLAKIEVERTRRQQTLTATGKMTFYRASVADTVSFSFAPWGFDEKPFEVRSLTLGSDGDRLAPQLVLRETSPLVYDWSATEEQIYAAAPRTTLPSAFDIAPPGVPVLTEELFATRDGTSVRVLIRAQWSASSSDYVDRYQVEGRRTEVNGFPTGDDWIEFGRTDQLTWEVRDVAPGTWEFRIKALSVLGVASDYVTADLEVGGLGTPPVALAGGNIQTAGGLAILTWDISTDLDVRIGGRIVIRHSGSLTPVWANSTSMDEVNGNSTVGVVPLKPGTYLIRPQDSSGVLGPVTTLTTKGATALTFANLETLSAHTAFSGTKTDVEVVTDTLRLVMPSQNKSPDPDDLSAVGYTPTRATVSTNVATPPGGSATADKLVEDSTAADDHFISFPVNVVAGRSYEQSLVVKADGRDRVQVRFADDGFPSDAVVNLLLGAVPPGVIRITLGAGIAAASLLGLGDGWYRVWARSVADTTFAGNAFSLFLADSAGALEYDGNGTSGALVADWRLVQTFPASEPYSGLYEFAAGMDLTTVKKARVQSDIVMSALNLAATIDDRTELIDEWIDFDDTDGALVDVVVEGRFTDDDPAGSPTWTSWRRLDSSEEEFRGAQFRAQLITESPDFNVVVEELSVTADEVV